MCLFFSFQKKIFSWYRRTGGLLKTRTHVVLTTILLQFYFIFFLAGTIDSLNRTRGKQNLHDWYVCFHVVIVINIEKSCWDLTHTWKTVCMHAQVWTLFHVTNQQSSQPGGWQPPQLPPQKVLTSIYCIIIQPFSSHLFLAHIRLIWLAPPDDTNDAI
jgi:hypothetical protein